jgi:hypothetical protein
VSSCKSAQGLRPHGHDGPACSAAQGWRQPAWHGPRLCGRWPNWLGGAPTDNDWDRHGAGTSPGTLFRARAHRYGVTTMSRWEAVAQQHLTVATGSGGWWLAPMGTTACGGRGVGEVRFNWTKKPHRGGAHRERGGGYAPMLEARQTTAKESEG